jgi:hypothetical protein
MAKHVTGKQTKAVTKVPSEILRLPKTNVKIIIKGFKSRDKSIAISFIDSDRDEAGCVARIRTSTRFYQINIIVYTHKFYTPDSFHAIQN